MKESDPVQPDTPGTPGQSESDKSPGELREFLYAAIWNAQTVITSVENRVPMALILHGLIFAGLVSIGTNLGAVWHHEPYRILLVIEFGLALIAFIVSVWAFVRCVTPPGSAVELNIPGFAPGEVPSLPRGELFFLSPNLRIGWQDGRLGPRLKDPREHDLKFQGSFQRPEQTGESPTLVVR